MPGLAKKLLWPWKLLLTGSKFLKCLICRDLLYRVPMVIADDSDDEAEMDELAAADSGLPEMDSWDILLNNDPDNYDITPTLILDVDME
ncbi:hypothetical protein K438DRAFT_1977226 [Mycena galopus ATCC 62051]|nr:hypothetical protein K438DRAFT_1977226 [Mycena galopus ATCC 62051]